MIDNIIMLDHCKYIGKVQLHVNMHNNELSLSTIKLYFF